MLRVCFVCRGVDCDVWSPYAVAVVTVKRGKVAAFSLKTYNSQTVWKVWGSWDYHVSNLQGICLRPSMEGYPAGSTQGEVMDRSRKCLLGACLHCA